MKLSGKKLKALAQAELVLPRPGEDAGIRLVVQAFPLGAEEEAERLFPSPVPPVKFAQGKRGKVLRDPATKEVVKVRDLEDPDFRAASRLANRRQMMFLITEGLKADPALEWETPTADREKDAGAWADNVFAECSAAGLSTGDLGMILDKIRELGNLTGQAVDDAVEDFLSEGSAV